MKKTMWLTCLTVLACGITFAAPPPEKAAAKPAAAATMTAQEKAALAKQIDLFAGVAAAGETQKDPLLLLSAVRMLDQLPFSGIAKPDGKENYSRDALLAQAKECAAGDAELLAVVAKLQDASEATAVRGWRHHGDGPGYYYDRPYHRHRFGCRMVRECDRRGCDWVCAGRDRYRDWD